MSALLISKSRSGKQKAHHQGRAKALIHKFPRYSITKHTPDDGVFSFVMTDIYLEHAFLQG